MRLQRSSIIEVGVNEKNCTDFGDNNMNINFGGYLHESANNIYSKLKPSMDACVESVGCSVHILHDTTQRAFHIVSIGIEGVLCNCSLISAFALSK